MPKFHSLIVSANPIRPSEIQRQIMESSGLDADHVLVRKKHPHAYVTLDTDDGEPRTFREITDLLPPEWLDEYLETRDVRIQVIGPINVDDVGEEESA